MKNVHLLLEMTRAHGIVRRYLIVNGFDGALTMLGIIVGFHVAGGDNPAVVITTCLGAGIALGMSGVTSAYVSEVAEKKKELRELENAMVTDLGQTAHGRAARVVPVLIALANGLSPLLISLVIVTPLWLADRTAVLMPAPLETSIGVALAVLFLLGVFLGKISGTAWLWAGLRTLLVGLLTAGLISLIHL
jgi:predicted membrane protein (TIGR00267 family)